MIEFRDEILEGEPRYRVRGTDGNLIHDNAAIEMSTPVVQQGTELNKAFFENIQAYIQSTDRYNLVNATVDTTIDGEYHKNFFKREWVKIADGQYKGGNMTISNDPEWDNPCYLGFDGDETTWAGERRSNTAFSKTLNIDYGEEIKITEFYVKINCYIDTGSIKLQASKDNSSWVDITTLNGKGSDGFNVEVTNPDWYRFYRIYSTSGYNYYGLDELQTKRAIVHQTQVLTLDLKLDEYDANKIIQIETSDDFDVTALDTYININNLGNIPINGLLKANTKYVLNYNNGKFDFQPAIYPKVSNNFSVKTGVINHGEVIPKTSGYDKYIYFVSFRSGVAQANWNNNYEINGAGTEIECFVDQSTRVVTAQITAHIRNGNDTTKVTANGTAQYIEIAWN